ncbi:hypothetical protein IWZ01DRAFT_483054 [Phyllosticta capitalensis]|uniref:Uncharacterized protein n=1 Tax=Phyllosticta capitalensis TaxID=121624 RepID=A0ABR1YLV6_9PEZI
MDRTARNQSLPQLNVEQASTPLAFDGLSVASLPSGTWDVDFRGSCPRCHQWHNKMVLRLSRLPGVWNGVRCQKCGHKWFGLSGDSKQITLVSHQMVKLSPAHIIAQTESGDRESFQDPFIDQWHAISAMDGPVLASTGPPKSLQDHPTRVQPMRKFTIPEALDSSQLARRGSIQPMDLDGATENNSRQTSRGQVPTLSIRKGVRSSTSQSHVQPRDGRETKESKVKGKMKTRLRKAISLLRGEGNLKREQKPRKSTNENPAITVQEQAATPILRDGPKVERAKIRKPAPAAVSRSATIKHTRCQSAPEETRHGIEDEGFQSIFLRSTPMGPACHNIFPQDMSELRRPRSLVARPLLCSCDPDCHCKRPSSSLIPERALTDRASLYGLDLAQSETQIRPSRRSQELAFIGTGFGGESNISIQSSILGPQQERSPSRRRPTSLHFGSSAMAYESQATTAYAQSEGGTVSDISVPTPRTSVFQQQQRDLFLLAPPANSPRTRIPSPSATPRSSVPYPHQHGDRDRDSANHLAHNRNFFEHLATESSTGRAPSVSPIQEAFDGGSGRVSSLSADDAEDRERHHGRNGGSPRVSYDDSQSHPGHGHSQYYEYWRGQDDSLEQRGSRSPGALNVQPVT